MTIAIIVIASVAGVIGVTAGIVSICTCMHTKKVLSTQSDEKTTVNVENETVNEEFVPPQYPKFLQITNGNKNEQEDSFSYPRKPNDNKETVIEMEMENLEQESTNDNRLKPKQTMSIDPKYNNTDKYGTGDLSNIITHHYNSDSNIVKRTKITQKINITNVDHKNIFSSEKTHQTGMHNEVANTLSNVPGNVLNGLTSIVGGMGGVNDNGIVSTITEGISNKLPSSKQNTKSLMLPRIQEIDDEKEDTDYTNSSNANKSIKSKPTKYDTFFEPDEDIPPIKSPIAKKPNSDLDNKNISKVQNNYKTNSLPVKIDTSNQPSNHKNTGLDNDLDTKSEIVKHLSIPTKHQRKTSFSETLKETISSQIENIEGTALNQISKIFGNSPFANNEVRFNNNGVHSNHDEIDCNGINHVNLGGSSEENNENESSDD